MTLYVDVSLEGGATVLRLSGSADSAGVAARREALAAAPDAPLVVVDLDGTACAAGQGLQELIGAASPTGQASASAAGARHSPGEASSQSFDARFTGRPT